MDEFEIKVRSSDPEALAKIMTAIETLVPSLGEDAEADVYEADGDLYDTVRACDAG